MKALNAFSVIALLTVASAAQAQKGGGRGHHGHPHYAHGGRGHHGHPHYAHGGRGKVVVVKRSPFRPKKMILFHPVWAPSYGFYRRWVFWPKYNFYWDNWRNSYFFWNGAMWVATTALPPAVININIKNEKHYELKENDDDVDDVYKGNSSHKEEYKPE